MQGHFTSVVTSGHCKVGGSICDGTLTYMLLVDKDKIHQDIMLYKLAAMELLCSLTLALLEHNCSIRKATFKEEYHVHVAPYSLTLVDSSWGHERVDTILARGSWPTRILPSHNFRLGDHKSASYDACCPVPEVNCV